MTNTLHRFGTAESFVDDIIVIAVPARGRSGQGDSTLLLRRFLEIAQKLVPFHALTSLRPKAPEYFCFEERQGWKRLPDRPSPGTIAANAPGPFEKNVAKQR